MWETLEEYNISGKLIRNIIIALIIFVIVFIAFNMFTFQVRENEAGVISRMGELVEIKEEAGLNFTVPILYSVTKLPTNMQYLDVFKSEVLTKDKKNYVVDTFIIWHIVDFPTFVRMTRTMSSAEEQLNAAVYGATKNILGQQNQDALIGVGYETGRDFVNEEITKMSNKAVKNLGIEIVSVEIKALDVPAENESAIFARMISERKQFAATYRANGEYDKSVRINEADRQIAIITAEAKRDAEKITGEAEAEYMRIWATAYDTPEKIEFYEYMRSLEALETALKGQKTLILSDESMLTQIVSGSFEAK